MKPPIGIIPRHFWLRDRIESCVDAIQETHRIEDWDLYRKQVTTFAEEILYCAKEWEKYYHDDLSGRES